MGCRGIRDWNERSVSVYISCFCYLSANNNADHSFQTFFDRAVCMSYLFALIFALVSFFGVISASLWILFSCDTFLPVHGFIYIHFQWPIGLFSHWLSIVLSIPKR